MVEAVVLNIHPVHQHLTAVTVVKPGYKRNQGGLTAAGRTDDSHRLPRFYCQVDLVEHGILTGFIISEIDVPKLYPALFYGQLLTGRMLVA